MKKASVIVFVLLLSTILFGCGNRGAEGSGGIEKTETNLEFWICDNADNIDFSNCQERYGIMGGREYYGSAYAPMKDANGGQVDPEECVIYTITSYPDYSSKAQHITGITITDPSVTVYGLTVKSSVDEVTATMTSYGYAPVEREFPGALLFEKEGIKFSFSDGCIRIIAEVSNENGIVF